MDKNNRKSDILTIVKEDILRILGEEEDIVSLDSIRDELKVLDAYISNAVKSLENENLILVKDNFIKLTQSGEVKAKEILKYHLILENYFKETKSSAEAHEISHILEHYISKEVIDNIKKLTKGKGTPLIEFNQRRGMISDISVGIGLFDRIISMGIYPGEEITVVNKTPSGVIFKVKNKKFFFNKEIAKKIHVIKDEKNKSSYYWSA
jgi:Mn-dependent DtxR family transcriptional regulator